jgi:amidase
MASADEWWRRSAVECVEALKARRISPRALLEVAAARIAATDGLLNAVPILCLDRARARADAFEKGGGAPGPLYGLPVLIKDTQSLVGVRFTKGEPRHAHRIGADTDPCIAAVEAAGGIVMGKVRRCSRARRAHTPRSLTALRLAADERAGVCGGLTHLQPDLRRHREPL